MADSPRKETPPPADSAPKILRFLVRVWGVVAGLCKYNCINLCINLFDVFSVIITTLFGCILFLIM